MKPSTTGRLLALLTLMGVVPLVATCSFMENFDSMKNGQCPSGKKACPYIRKCVPLDDPATGCGDTLSCSSCAEHANATASCEQKQCAIQCKEGWANCDQLADNGCETELAASANFQCPDDGGTDGSVGAGGASGAAGSSGMADSGGGGRADGAASDAPKVVSPCKVTVDFNGFTPTNVGCGGYTTGCKGQIHFVNAGSTTWSGPTLSFTVRSGVVCTKSHSFQKWNLLDSGATSHRCIFAGRNPDANGISWPIGPAASFGFGYDTNQVDSVGPTDITVAADGCTAPEAGTMARDAEAGAPGIEASSADANSDGE